jgi:Outer membrane lipoprotein carrier protein LolA-like
MMNTVAFSRTIEDLERQLRRTPPVTTGFVEYRFSHLLKKPLRTSGTLEYRSDGVLARNVAAPYQEATEVNGDQVRITRGDKPARTLSLQRAPQLRVLLGSFRALLEGRLVPLQTDFDLTLDDDASSWTLTLKPHDVQLAKHLARIEVHGSGGRPFCLEALEPDGDGAITLMSDEPATGATLPTRAELEHSCRPPPASHAAVDTPR